MAVLSINQPTDLYETECQQAALETLGYKFVYSDENIALTQSDFSSDAEAMKAAGAEGVVFVATASYYAEVATAAQNAGLNMQLPFYDVNEYDPLYVSQAGSAANGSITASPFEMYQGQDAISNPTIALFDKYYEAVSGGSAPNEFGIWAWMSGMLFIEGLNAGGGLTRADLLSGLSKVTAFTAGGMEGPSNPAAKTAPSCWLAIDVVNQKFVRDPADPATGMICPSSNTYDTITNIPFPS
jgi:ABC-type branched-subunit amino acid transport system substrate-binding protein